MSEHPTTPVDPSATHGDGLVDTRMMVVVHALLRRELGLAVVDVRATAVGDVARAAVVGQHLTMILQGLHEHHTHEDDMLWDVLIERVRVESADLAPVIERMEAQHARLAGLVEQTPALVEAWRASASAETRDALADHVAEEWRLMCEHLEDEETHVLPLMSRHLRQEEWDAFAKAGADSTPRQLRLVSLGMMLYEGDPEVLGIELAKAPVPLRWIGPPLARRSYRRYARRVHLTETPTRGDQLSVV